MIFYHTYYDKNVSTIASAYQCLRENDYEKNEKGSWQAKIGIINFNWAIIVLNDLADEKGFMNAVQSCVHEILHTIAFNPNIK